MKAQVKDNKLIFRKNFKATEIPLENIAWAYLQEENVETKMCCSRASFVIGRLVVFDKNGRKEIFQYEGMSEPKNLLRDLEAASNDIAIGFTKENKEKFQAFIK